MKSTETSIGRVFILQFDHGDDFHNEISRFCVEKGIKAGQLQFLGAIKHSSVVVGPQSDTLPPKPEWHDFNEPQEVVGYGTIFIKNKTPSVHIHAVFSRKDKAFIGCIRKSSEVFIIIEAVLFEFMNVDIKRVFDNKTGLDIMNIFKKIE